MADELDMVISTWGVAAICVSILFGHWSTNEDRTSQFDNFRPTDDHSIAAAGRLQGPNSRCFISRCFIVGQHAALTCGAIANDYRIIHRKMGAVN